jgi:hypothetical protein
MNAIINTLQILNLLFSLDKFFLYHYYFNYIPGKQVSKITANY